MSEHKSARLLAMVEPGYRVHETLEGWCLEYQDPAMGRWHLVAARDSVARLMVAYQRICDGETVDLYDDEETQ